MSQGGSSISHPSGDSGGCMDDELYGSLLVGYELATNSSGSVGGG